jgi:hypothetical protein
MVVRRFDRDDVRSGFGLSIYVAVLSMLMVGDSIMVKIDRAFGYRSILVA